jgi:UDP-3-O-[3-hydroxymyristoyl] glucosamine N-acyltransferase
LTVRAPSAGGPAAGAAGGAPPSLSAADVAQRVGGTLRGDGSVRVSAVAPLRRAGDGELSFFAKAAYLEEFKASHAAIVLVSPEFADAAGPACRVIVEHPPEAMLKLLPALYAAPSFPPGVHPTAVIGRGARLGKDVSVGPYAVLGDEVTLGDRVVIGAHSHVQGGVRIGDDSHLVSAVTVYSGSVIGRRVRLHAGVRLGSDGFGYVYAAGAHQKIPHVGRCLVEDDVEIGANTAIDRGSIDDTVIGAGTKIDNLVHIAHNVRVGRLCLIAAQVGISGSTVLGDGAVLAGQVGVGGHLSIGAGAKIAGQAGVSSDVPPGESWSGTLARPHRETLVAQAALGRLAKIVKELERLVGRGPKSA